MQLDLRNCGAVCVGVTTFLFVGAKDAIKLSAGAGLAVGLRDVAFDVTVVVAVDATSAEVSCSGESAFRVGLPALFCLLPRLSAGVTVDPAAALDLLAGRLIASI